MSLNFDLGFALCILHFALVYYLLSITYYGLLVFALISRLSFLVSYIMSRVSLYS